METSANTNKSTQIWKLKIYKQEKLNKSQKRSTRIAMVTFSNIQEQSCKKIKIQNVKKQKKKVSKKILKCKKLIKQI